MASTTGTQPTITPTVAGSVSRTASITNTLKATRPVAASAPSPSASRACDAREPTARDREQQGGGEQVAQQLALGERVALEAVRGCDERADEGQRDVARSAPRAVSLTRTPSARPPPADERHHGERGVHAAVIQRRERPKAELARSRAPPRPAATA